MRVVSLVRSEAVAFPAGSTFFADTKIRVLCSEFVSIYAELLLFVMMSLPTFIFFLGYSFKVIWSAAQKLFTEMINLESFGDWADQQSINYSMGVLHTSAPVYYPVFDCFRTTCRSGPEPASSLKVGTNFRLQAIRQIAKIPITHRGPHDIGTDVMGAILLERQG